MKILNCDVWHTIMILKWEFLSGEKEKERQVHEMDAK